MDSNQTETEVPNKITEEEAKQSDNKEMLQVDEGPEMPKTDENGFAMPKMTRSPKKISEDDEQPVKPKIK
jgi:hypothetical protein